MGFSGISVTELLVIMAIVLLLFGSKKLSSLGSDLGGRAGFPQGNGARNPDRLGAEYRRQRAVFNWRSSLAGLQERTDLSQGLSGQRSRKWKTL